MVDVEKRKLSSAKAGRVAGLKTTEYKAAFEMLSTR